MGWPEEEEIAGEGESCGLPRGERERSDLRERESSVS
jgi:hypothetical protein